ncbi:MAG: metallophosphoesterase [Oscillospiraceae bacterium]|nr:metallophosphoesterase [Oscillospiraceae bacterium]MDD3833134.1 metallophosphoesterase [Oscillospiraceae bacterium]MDD4545854.1 metallophosphoesterase [Oscillospiraceae bacterium]
MSLFAIADLHLSLGTDKPMDVFRGWDNHVARLEGNWWRLVSDDDTVVIAGDISWAISLEQAKQDFAFLNSLPGRKLIIKGNHDYWWTTRRKMDEYFEEYGYNTLSIIHNSAEVSGNYAVCGTRGWFFDAEEDIDKKILMREVGRLKMSIDAAEKTGKEPVVFLHYPPFMGDSKCDEILSVLKERAIRLCYYGHIHGPNARRIPERAIDGTIFKLISCDAVDFSPVPVG